MWLRIAVITTIAYLAIIVLVISNLAHECNDVHGWLPSPISCLKANELGDFLSGAFAPVAFLWLVAAVFIQSKELAAQREELKATRQEVADNRLVLERQAEQARRQADFIGEQTENQKRIADKEYREEMDDLFDVGMHAFQRDIMGPLSEHQYAVQTSTGEHRGSFGNYRLDVYDFNVPRLFQTLTDLNSALKLPRRGGCTIPLQQIKALSAALGPLLDRYDELSPATQMRVQGLRLFELRDLAGGIASRETDTAIADALVGVKS